MKKNFRWLCILLFVATVAVVGFLFVTHHSRIELSYLENSLKEAQQREEKAIVVRRVSKQMEEIAYQQKEISDKQRKEAELQAKENFKMKLLIEEEWKKAVEAKQEALQAYRLADKQKALAEERQRQAEYAKRVADTLAYLTLGRALGSLSITQYKTGNYEIAALLAYSAWNFVGRYQGDTFLPSVFNSLSLSAGKTLVWQNHKGGIISIVRPLDARVRNTYYTVSKYGEIVSWSEDRRGGYSAKTLFIKPEFDFRAACMLPNDTLCALSYDGKLLKFFQKRYEVIPLEGKGYIQMLSLDGKLLLLSADRGLVFLGKEKPLWKTTDITCVARADSSLLVGWEDGEIICMSLSGTNKISLGKLHPAAVTAFGYCHSSGQFAVGYKDGMLFLFDKDGKRYQKLVGHRSAISQLMLLGDKLYSCSYDRTLRLWNLVATKRLESVVVLENSSWLQSLDFNPQDETLLVGDEDGNLHSLSVSPDKMAGTIKKNLHRNFTPEEWTYYIGSQIPYEVYALKEHDL